VLLVQAGQAASRDSSLGWAQITFTSTGIILAGLSLQKALAFPSYIKRLYAKEASFAILEVCSFYCEHFSRLLALKDIRILQLKCGDCKIESYKQKSMEQ